MTGRDPVAVIACVALVACVPRTRRLHERQVREVSILGVEGKVCPGERIHARYVAQLDDGSSHELRGDELARLSLAGDAATPAADGAWNTDADPIASAFRGFRLRAFLLDDSIVTAMAVVVPDYGCSPRHFRFVSRTAGGAGPEVTVRIAQMRTPFYDSLVVVAVETEAEGSVHAVFEESALGARVLHVASTGGTGRSGNNGPPGSQGSPCSNGGDGIDGTDGFPGGEGGQVIIVADSAAPRLAEYIEPVSVGGRGGVGGTGVPRTSQALAELIAYTMLARR